MYQCRPGLQAVIYTLWCKPVDSWRMQHCCGVDPRANSNQECRAPCLQIQAVLNIILDRAAQTAAEHAKAGLQQRQGHQGAGDYDAAVAAKWAAANPPDSCGCRSSSSGCDGPLQQQQGDGHAQLAERSPADSDAAAAAVPGRGVRVCVHYYSPRVHASLSDVYSQARALLAPPPPPVDPPKKGERLCWAMLGHAEACWAMLVPSKPLPGPESGYCGKCNRHVQY
jgi:hypothetical protein